MSGINCSVIVSQPFSVACIFAYSMTIILPIMLALCLMHSGTYYAQNYASIIGRCLILHSLETNALLINSVFDFTTYCNNLHCKAQKRLAREIFDELDNQRM